MSLSALTLLPARVHTLTPSHRLLSICAHPGDTLSPLQTRVYPADTQYPRPPLYVHGGRQLGLGEGMSFTIATRHVLIPLSFPLSRPTVPTVGRGVCERRGRKQTGVRFSKHARLSTSFSSPCSRLAATDAPKNNSRERIMGAGSCQGRLLSVTSLMCAARK